MTKPTVCMLGTGLMGGPMARNILKAGFPLRVWNRTREKAEPLAADGAVVCDTPVEAVSGAKFVITMLTDGSAVESVLFDDGGVAAAMELNGILIDMSSIRPAEARAHGERLTGQSIGYLDAPVSGGTRGAADGTLAIMAGGSQEVFETAVPVLETMGRPVRVGPTGAGQLAKLCNQAIVAVTIGAVAEAMLLMEKAGGNPDKLREALAGGFADSTILQQHGKRMIDNDFKPGGLSWVQLKDLKNVVGEMRNAGLRLPLAEMMHERYERLVQELDGSDLDHSAIYLELLERNAINSPRS